MADKNLQQNTVKVVIPAVKQPPVYYRLPSFLVSTPIFWTAFNAFIMTVGVFAIVMANSVLLARESGATEQVSLALVAISLAAGGVLHTILQLFLGRFDSENKKQRLVIYLPLLIIFSAFVVHNVFWYLGLRFDPDNFPKPNSLSFCVVGFVMCFIVSFSGWYQLKYIHRIYV